jgi:hypothetical protein
MNLFIKHFLQVSISRCRRRRHRVMATTTMPIDDDMFVLSALSAMARWAAGT